MLSNAIYDTNELLGVLQFDHLEIQRSSDTLREGQHLDFSRLSRDEPSDLPELELLHHDIFCYVLPAVPQNIFLSLMEPLFLFLS